MTPAKQRRREARLRQIAARNDLSLRKSRSPSLSVKDHGEYMLVHGWLNGLVAAGENYSATLEEIEEILLFVDERRRDFEMRLKGFKAYLDGLEGLSTDEYMNALELFAQRRPRHEVGHA